MPKNTDICKECGYEYQLHSAGERCPKNGGQLIGGKLEFFASHFEPEISETDKLRARIATLEADAKLNDMAWNDNQAALNKQAAEIVRLTEKVRYAYVQIEALEEK